MNPGLHALNRFGLGARPGEAAGIGSDPRGWLEAQLDGPAPAVAAAGLRDLPALGDLLRVYRQALAGEQAERREALQSVARTVSIEATAALSERIASRRPFVERWVAFWSNHLCVSAASGVPVRLMAGAYEREAIRPHALGRFEDMLLASARHPAMLVYLDNARSVGPNSRAARSARGPREIGLNENYARELLELHTVGVDGGYTQDDVLELARILTGWTVAGMRQGAGRRAAAPQATLGFTFEPPLHEPGAKRVMGVRYPESGEDEGRGVLRDLSRRPETARFLASKLVGHFVSDDPPQAAVDRVAEVYRDSDGDLREVARAMVHLDEAWDPAFRKFRTPQDWIVAAMRGLGAEEAAPALPPLLRELRHPLWAPGAPKGFGDTTGEWADPGSLLNRTELARTLAARVVARASRTDPAALADLVPLPADDPLRALLADASIPTDERVALALAGPAFQWR